MARYSLAPRDTGSPDPEKITGRSYSIRSETRWRTEDLRIQRKGDNSEGSCGYGLFKCLGVPNGIRQISNRSGPFSRHRSTLQCQSVAAKDTGGDRLKGLPQTNAFPFPS